MFEFLNGRVEALPPGAAVLRTGGVGWRLQVSERTAAGLQPGGTVRLFVHLAVGENALSLYGFCDEAERVLFRRLLQVSGIGPSSALGLLSAFAPEELVAAVLDGDTGRMTAVKGIGRRTADRLIVELRDRLGDLPAVRSNAAPGSDELARVLLDLGFRPPEARTAAEAAREALGEDAPLEQLLRQALRPS